jgi:DUF4097 and DUF4098 domain-containing protein YvlB
MTSKYLLGAIKIVIFSIIALASTYIFLTLFNGQALPFSFPERKEPNIVLQNIVLDDTINSIDLEWYSGGVEITKSSDNRIHIVEKSSVQLEESRWVRPVVNGETLVLHSRNKYNFVLFFFQSPESYLELQLPDQAYESFKTLVTSGNYSISDFDINRFNLTMTSGNLHVNNVNSEDMNITMTSGDAFFIQVKTNTFDINMTSGNTSFTGTISNELDVMMTSGNLDLDTSNDSPSQLNVDMTSGNANLTLSEDEGFQISIDKTSGNFNPDSKLTRLNDSLYQYLDYKHNYLVDMTSGSLSIRLK